VSQRSPKKKTANKSEENRPSWGELNGHSIVFGTIEGEGKGGPIVKKDTHYLRKKPKKNPHGGD